MRLESNHQEHERGSISPGKFADLVILSEDCMDPKNRDRLAEAKVLVTVVGGRIVHDDRPTGER